MKKLFEEMKKVTEDQYLPDDENVCDTCGKSPTTIADAQGGKWCSKECLNKAGRLAPEDLVSHDEPKPKSKGLKWLSPEEFAKLSVQDQVKYDMSHRTDGGKR